MKLRYLIIYISLVAAFSILVHAADDVDQYIRDLNSSDTAVKKQAILVLGEAKEPRATEPLIHLLNDENASIRAAAIWALGEINDSASYEPIILALNDEDPQVRAEAAWTLGRTDGSQIGGAPDGMLSMMPMRMSGQELPGPWDG